MTIGSMTKDSMINLDRRVMRGQIILQDFISREDARTRPTSLFVFGDNMARTGLGGQAQLRGEPNAVGIPTKWRPSKADGSYFTDADRLDPDVRHAVLSAFKRLTACLDAGGVVVIPAKGIGTGLGGLEYHAPVFAIWLDNLFADLLGRPMPWTRARGSWLLQRGPEPAAPP